MSNSDLIKKEYQEFSYIVSHDLGAPLRQIKGFLSLLLDEMNIVTEDQKLYRDMIFAALSQGEDILAGLLQFSRLNQYETSIEAIDAEEFFIDYKNNFDEMNIQNESMVNADRGLLHRIIDELIINARKFQVEDQKPILGLSVDQGDDHTVISIADNGIGIEPKYYERVFKPLSKLHTREDYEGCGMGLTLCQKMMQLQNASISLRSNEDVGLTVLLYFPKR